MIDIVISSHAVDIDFILNSVLKRALKYTFCCRKNKGVVKQ